MIFSKHSNIREILWICPVLHITYRTKQNAKTENFQAQYINEREIYVFYNLSLTFSACEPVINDFFLIKKERKE